MAIALWEIKSADQSMSYKTCTRPAALIGLLLLYCLLRMRHNSCTVSPDMGSQEKDGEQELSHISWRQASQELDHLLLLYCLVRTRFNSLT